MKKHWHGFLLLLPVLFLGGVLPWKMQQPEYVLRQFSARNFVQNRSQDRAQDHLMALENWQRARMRPEPALRIGDRAKVRQTAKRLLWLSWYGIGGSLNECDVDDEGGLLYFGISLPDAWSWSEETRYLSSIERGKLSSSLSQLPLGVAPAPAKESVIFVSYFDGVEWKTQVYDRRHLPLAFRQILQLPTMSSLLSLVEQKKA